MKSMSRRTWAGLIGVVVTTAALVSVATLAVADHTFPDVTDGNPFHNEIAAVAGAGIATGFPDDTFRPRDTVNRQQFAGWMNRGAGRASFAQSQATLDTSGTYEAVTSVTVTAGAAGEGRGLVVLHGALDIFTTDTVACPCRVTSVIARTDTNASALERYSMIPGGSDEGGSSQTGLSNSWMVEIDAGQTLTFELRARFLDDDLDPPIATGELTAIYVPFAGDGTAVPESAPESQAEDRRP